MAILGTALLLFIGYHLVRLAERVETIEAALIDCADDIDRSDG